MTVPGMERPRLDVKAKLFRGLADPVRLSILETLLGGPKTVAEVVQTTRESQPNVSNHLRCLLDCNLVSSRREGRHVYYRLRNGGVKRLLLSTDRLLSEIHAEIAACVNYERR